MTTEPTEGSGEWRRPEPGKQLTCNVLVFVACPHCRRRVAVSRLTHRIEDDGTIHPTVRCESCWKVSAIRLQNWKPDKPERSSE